LGRRAGGKPSPPCLAQKQSLLCFSDAAAAEGPSVRGGSIASSHTATLGLEGERIEPTRHTQDLTPFAKGAPDSILSLKARPSACIIPLRSWTWRTGTDDPIRKKQGRRF